MRAAGRRARLAANFVLFQAAWFWLVLAPAGWDVAGGVAALAAHLRWIGGAGEWRLLLATAAVGAVVDSLLAAAGIFSFFPPGAVAPLWLILLWALFASVLPHSLRWLAALPKPLAALAGAIFAPAAYWGGAQICDKMAIAADFWVFAPVHAAIWAAALPAGLALGGRFAAVNFGKDEKSLRL